MGVGGGQSPLNSCSINKGNWGTNEDSSIRLQSRDCAAPQEMLCGNNPIVDNNNK